MDSNKMKNRLETLKQELEQRLQRTHKHIYEKDEAVSADFHEQVKQTENDQLVYTLEEEGRQELKQVNHALQRLESGEYSTCSKCGSEIHPDRLNAVPYTEFCINCA